MAADAPLGEAGEFEEEELGRAAADAASNTVGLVERGWTGRTRPSSFWRRAAAWQSRRTSSARCLKGEQWQRAMALLADMAEAKMEKDIMITYSTAINVSEKAQQWQLTLELVVGLAAARIQADQIQRSAAISASEKGGQAFGWDRATDAVEVAPSDYRWDKPPVGPPWP